MSHFTVMVGGNLVKEPIPWDTVDAWFVKIDKLVKNIGSKITEAIEQK